MAKIVRALSIKQPFVEMILRGDKTKEYRGRATNIRERVYLYASLKPRDWPAGWKKIGKQPGDLVTGMIVGTVEIVDCKKQRDGGYAWLLAKPKRLRRHLAPTNQPQPGFWRPQF